MVLYRFESDKVHLISAIVFLVLCGLLLISGLAGVTAVNQSKCAKEIVLYGKVALVDCLAAVSCGFAVIALSLVFYCRYISTGKIPII